MSKFTVAVGEIGAHAKKLTANTMDTVTFEGDPDAIEVVSEDGAAAIDFTINGPDPTVGGNPCERLPAAVCAREFELNRGAPHVVKLISNSTPTYSVQAVSK